VPNGKNGVVPRWFEAALHWLSQSTVARHRGMVSYASDPRAASLEGAFRRGAGLGGCVFRAQSSAAPPQPQGAGVIHPFAPGGRAWALMGLRGGTWIPSPGVRHALATRAYLFLRRDVDYRPGGGLVLAMRLARNDGIGSEDAGAIYMWTAVWSIVGARLLYVITQFQEFSNPVDIVMLNKAACRVRRMLGGFLASWYGCHRRKIALLRWADASAPSVVLGTAITRVGCLLFGCDYGKVSHVAWPSVPKDARLEDHVYNMHALARTRLGRCPSIPRRSTRRWAGSRFWPGHVLASGAQVLRRGVLGWVMGYGIVRPIIEIYRGDDDRGSVGTLSTRSSSDWSR